MSKATLSLYGQTYQEIIDKVLGGAKDKKFQLTYPFIDWTWPTPPAGYIDPTAYTYVSRIPQRSAIGESYRPTGKDLHSQYLSMLLHAPKLTISPEQQQQLKEADEQITKCQNKIQEDTNAKNRAWQMANSNLPVGVPKPKWDEWCVTSGWEKTLKSDRAALDKAAKTKQLIVSQQNPEYNDAVAAATPPESTLELKPGYVLCNVAPGQAEVRPNYLIGTSGSDWIAQLTRGGMPLNIQLSASKSSSALQESWARCVIRNDYWFFSGYSENSWKELDFASDDKTVQVSINIKAVTQVPIAPDSAWYKSGYLDVLKTQNNWNPPYTTAKGKAAYIEYACIRDLVQAGTGCSSLVILRDYNFHEHKVGK